MELSIGIHEKRGCKPGGSKTGAVLCPKRGAVVSQLVPGGDNLVLSGPGCVCPKVKDKRPFLASTE